MYKCKRSLSSAFSSPWSLPLFPGFPVCSSLKVGTLASALHCTISRKETQRGQKDERKKSYRADPATASHAASASGVWCHYWSSLVGQGNSTPTCTHGSQPWQGRGMWATGLLVLYSYKMGRIKRSSLKDCCCCSLLVPTREGDGGSCCFVAVSHLGQSREIPRSVLQGLPPDSLTRKSSFLQELFLTV